MTDQVRRRGSAIAGAAILGAAAALAFAGPAVAAPAQSRAGGRPAASAAPIRVRNIDVGGFPSQAAVDPHTGAVWVAATTQLVRIREATQRVSARVGIDADLVAVDPTTSTVWAVDTTSDTMFEVSEATSKVIHRIRNLGFVAAFAVDPRTGVIWVASGGSLLEISEATRKVTHTVPLHVNLRFQGTGQVVVDPKADRVWVVIIPESPSPTHTWIAEFSGSARQVIYKLPYSGDNATVAVDSPRGTLWAVFAGTAEVIRESDHRFLRAFHTGPGASWNAITIDSRARTVLVADSSDDVRLVGESTGKVLRQIRLAPFPTEVAADLTTGNAYVPRVAPTGHAGRRTVLFVLI